MNCPLNPALDRQLRMLSNLTKINCSGTTDATANETVAMAMLEDAKRNLKSIAFFGLTEYQQESQLLFECTFNMTFIRSFVSSKPYNTRIIGPSMLVSKAQEAKIKQLNKWDTLFYNYAEKLFLYRIKLFNIEVTSKV